MTFMRKLLDVLNMDNWGKEKYDEIIPDNTCDAQVGYELLKSLWVGGNISEETKRVLKECKSREEVCLKAIDYCDPPTTQKRLYVTSYSYVAAGAKYRNLAIKFLKEYIKVGAYWEGTPKDTFKFNGRVCNQLLMNKADAFCCLAKCYEGEYMFELAIENYICALNIYPSFQAYYVRIADVYRKMNLLDKSIQIMEDAKKTKYYKTDADFKLVVDNYYQKYTKMKNRGYLYRPRKKKPLS